MNRSKDKDNEKKLMDEYCQRKLTKMLQDEDNKYCVDCDAKGPRWVSWNLGVFLCIRCAGIHRNLGVHISRVKSVNLDTWTPEQVVCLEQMGNSRARAVYEANVPDNFRRPQTDSSLESLIRAKYEAKKYIAKEWVPTPIPTKVDWEKEMEIELEKQKKKKKTPSVTSGTPITIPAPSGDKKASKTASIPPPLSKSGGNFNSPKSGRTERKSASSDLLGLNAASVTEPVVKAPEPVTSDNFANFLSSAATENSVPVKNSCEPVVPAQTAASKSDGFSSLDKEEADFFNQTPASKEAAAKLTKDSILALYSAGPTIPAMTAINPIANSYPNFNGSSGTGPFGMTGFGAAAPQAFHNNQFAAQPQQQQPPPQQQQVWPTQIAAAPQWTTPMQPAPFPFQTVAPNLAGITAAAPLPPSQPANDSITKHFGSLNLNNVWQ